MNPDAEMHARWDRIDEQERHRARELRDAIAVEQAQKRPDPKRLRRLRAQLEIAEEQGE
jgi:predicted DNA-binding WGR domain protein